MDNGRFFAGYETKADKMMDVAAIYYQLYDIYRNQAKHERERVENGLY